MGDEADSPGPNDPDLPDFDDVKPENGGGGSSDSGIKGSGGISASGFRDFLLKQELLQGIIECGFEHPSEVQHACIPQAMLSTDILCQAKSGMGKTAVFVLACLHCVDLSEATVRVLVLCHTRELAFQIQHEFQRLGKHMPKLKVAAIYGGTPVDKDKEMFKKECPHILCGTPGRVLQLMNDKGALSLAGLTHFVLDECDKCIDTLSLRRDVQQIFIKTPKKKQVMMFSATMSPETRAICTKFMREPHEITVESEAKLTLHGLLQYVVELDEKQKMKKLVDLLDVLEFNQVVIFVKNVKRALALDGYLNECKFPSMTLHPLPPALGHKGRAGDLVKPSDGRIERLKAFKDFKKRILVVTDLFGRGMDVERVNIVINFDMPPESDTYLHRVGRAGRFGTKGLAVSFCASEQDKEVMSKVQARFEVAVPDLPDKIDTTSYLNA